MLRLSHAAAGGAHRVAMRCVHAGRVSGPAFVVAVALLFAASAAATILGCLSMATMRAQPMPGDWMLSTMWTPMCGQAALAAALASAGMWCAMMVAMMLPSLAPVLWRHRAALDRRGVARADRLVGCVAAGYFAVWIGLGLAIFAFGAVASGALLQRPAWSRAVPALAGAVVVVAGMWQFGAWKRHRLARCRTVFVRSAASPGMPGAWRQGLRLGLRCNAACANLTAALLALGAMDLSTMAFMTAVITAERLAPRDANLAWGIGVVLVGAGACLLGQALA